MKNKCDICGSDKEVRNINLYVKGSEGVNLCNGCQIAICKFIRDMINIAESKVIEFIKENRITRRENGYR